MKIKKKKVLVLYGGPSSERDVSVRSAKSVISNLDKNKYNVSKILIPQNLKNFFNNINNKKILDSDVVFLIMHGYFGEDGKIQSYLDSLGVKYTGSSALSSMLCINKYLSTHIIKSHNILTPKSFLINKLTEDLDVENLQKEIKFPLFLKPNNGGSSDGAGIVNNKSEIVDRLKGIWKIDNEAIAQEIISGRELTCAVLGDYRKEVIALPPIEIPKQGEFFDRKIKYAKNTIELCPAPINKSQMEDILSLSKKIHKALFCNGITRSDFILMDNKFYYLETNTIPGMTETSLVPKEAKTSGISFSSLLDKIIELALK